MNEIKNNTSTPTDEIGQVEAIVIRRPETPEFNENGAPFFKYCVKCGQPTYSDEYCETLDCLGICDDCYLFADEEEREDDFYDEEEGV